MPKKTEKTNLSKSLPNKGNQIERSTLEALLKIPLARKLICETIVENKEKIEKYKREYKEARTLKYSRLASYETPSVKLRRKNRELVLSENEKDQSSNKLVPFNEKLEYVFAYVDVWSLGINRSSDVEELVKAMGGRVTKYFNSWVSHVVFQEGSDDTFKNGISSSCHMVSIRWLEAVKHCNFRIPEINYNALQKCVTNERISDICEINDDIISGKSTNTKIISQAMRLKTKFQTQNPALVTPNYKYEYINGVITKVKLRQSISEDEPQEKLLCFDKDEADNENTEPAIRNVKPPNDNKPSMCKALFSDVKTIDGSVASSKNGETKHMNETVSFASQNVVCNAEAKQKVMLCLDNSGVNENDNVDSNSSVKQTTRDRKLHDLMNRSQNLDNIQFEMAAYSTPKTLRSSGKITKFEEANGSVNIMSKKTLQSPKMFKRQLRSSSTTKKPTKLEHGSGDKKANMHMQFETPTNYLSKRKIKTPLKRTAKVVEVGGEKNEINGDIISGNSTDSNIMQLKAIYKTENSIEVTPNCTINKVEPNQNVNKLEYCDTTCKYFCDKNENEIEKTESTIKNGKSSSFPSNDNKHSVCKLCSPGVTKVESTKNGNMSEGTKRLNEEVSFTFHNSNNVIEETLDAKAKRATIGYRKLYDPMNRSQNWNNMQFEMTAYCTPKTGAKASRKISSVKMQTKRSERIKSQLGRSCTIIKFEELEDDIDKKENSNNNIQLETCTNDSPQIGTKTPRRIAKAVKSEEVAGKKENNDTFSEASANRKIASRTRSSAKVPPNYELIYEIVSRGCSSVKMKPKKALHSSDSVGKASFKRTAKAAELESGKLKKRRSQETKISLN